MMPAPPPRCSTDCEVCGRSFSDLSKLSKHMKGCRRSRPLKKNPPVASPGKPPSNGQACLSRPPARRDDNVEQQHNMDARAARLAEKWAVNQCPNCRRSFSNSAFEVHQKTCVWGETSQSAPIGVAATEHGLSAKSSLYKKLYASSVVQMNRWKMFSHLEESELPVDFDSVDQIRQMAEAENGRLRADLAAQVDIQNDLAQRLRARELQWDAARAAQEREQQRACDLERQLAEQQADFSQRLRVLGEHAREADELIATVARWRAEAEALDGRVFDPSAQPFPEFRFCGSVLTSMAHTAAAERWHAEAKQRLRAQVAEAEAATQAAKAAGAAELAEADSARAALLAAQRNTERLELLRRRDAARYTSEADKKSLLQASLELNDRLKCEKELAVAEGNARLIEVTRNWRASAAKVTTQTHHRIVLDGKVLQLEEQKEALKKWALMRK